ncbi:MAG: hypothetical protein PHW04_04085 [Candidatus Wallbacteria bacterium]|nr:hypothetical protein [Candidatus Wallbacteria bacterium]
MEMMKDWMETWEKNTAAWVDELTKSQNFVKNYLKTYEPALTVSKNFRETQEKFYELTGIPSREDIFRVMQKLQDVETKISDVCEKLDSIEEKIVRIEKTDRTPKTVKSTKTAGTSRQKA